MQAFVTALTGESGITAAGLWGAVTPIAPLIVIMVFFSLGLYMVKKPVKGAGKGKVRI